ncbi:MAG TPA: hypothetical protein ENH78_09835 [Phycisphaerae bacterium]|nr:hypothetical protein [Phycisphaerae bacterium]
MKWHGHSIAGWVTSGTPTGRTCPMTKTVIVPINVSSRVLRHISRGIYRTPAGALKELVSNAYDAGARHVTVNTGWPVLREIVITDDGKGMTRDEFIDLVKHIGFTKKQAGKAFTIPGTRIKRRTIGHYGIGLLAVGQLAKVMRITSKTAGTLGGFVAEIGFEQFEEVEEDGVSRSTVKDEAALEEVDHRSRNAPSGLKIGECKITTTRYGSDQKDEAFTRIALSGIRAFVQKHLAGDLADLNPDRSKSKAYSPNYQRLLELLRVNERDMTLGWYPYERLVWEMGVYCPVRYPDVGEYKEGGKLHSIARLAARAKFELRIDGILVTKPFEKSFFNDSDYPVEGVFTWDNEPFLRGRPECRTSGYIIYKRRIRPKILHGILVREGGVAIGGYDSTYLRYPFNEGQKFNQLTGEIYAEGLSGALNIDRNSFNETDDVYMALSKWVHKKLQQQVFSTIKKLQRAPGSARRAANRRDIQETLCLATELTDCEFRRVRFEALGKSELLLRIRGKTLIINQDHRDGVGSSSRQEKALLAAALVLTGITEPDEIQEAENIVQQAKKALKARGDVEEL